MKNNTYIALLRGINVSGQKKIKMADLRVLLDGIGFSEVGTYIQSGNVVFQVDPANPADPAALAAKIKGAILSHYGWEVQTLVLKPEDLEAAVAGYPWHDKKDRTPDQVYLTFLETLPAPENIAALDPTPYAPEEIVLTEKVIYFFPPDGAGRAKMNNNLFERKLKVNATTRNWRTTNKLIEMARA